jgi:hypothetical protein
MVILRLAFLSALVGLGYVLAYLAILWPFLCVLGLVAYLVD